MVSETVSASYLASRWKVSLRTSRRRLKRWNVQPVEKQRGNNRFDSKQVLGLEIKFLSPDGHGYLPGLGRLRKRTR